jgi:uncharacterized membrane protein YkvA (DUF1232 family)
MEANSSEALNAVVPTTPAAERVASVALPVSPSSEGGNPELDRFWIALRRLPKYLKLAANLARDGEVPRSAKAILAVGAVYTISPVDLVPGFIPVAGQLDDLLVLILALRTATRACQPAVAAAHLQRAGLNSSNFDDDLAAAKDTAVWLGKKGLRGSRRLAVRSGRRLERLWQERVRST